MSGARLRVAVKGYGVIGKRVADAVSHLGSRAPRRARVMPVDPS